MKGSNPLFVDSTKFAGDGIRTQFEVSHLFLYEDESVFAKVTNKDGHGQIVPLHFVSEGVFSGSIYLKHQEEITYHFYLKKDGEITFKTKERNGRAAYAVADRWEPELDVKTQNEKPKLINLKNETVTAKPLPEFESQRKSLMSAVEALHNFFPEIN